MSSRRKLAALAAAAVIAIGVLLAWKGDKVVDRILDMRYGKVLPKPQYPKPRDMAEANRQDLEYLARFPEVDRSFSDEAKVEFSRRVAKLKEGSANLSRGELLMGVAKALAVADNPHTNVERAYWRAYLNSAPVRFEWFAEGLFIVRARPDHAALLGARVVAIDGMSPELIVRDASKYFGGPPEHGRVSSLLVMESPQALHVLYAHAPDDRLIVTLDEGNAVARKVELPAVAALEAPPVLRPGRLLSPESDFGEKTPWRGVLDDVRPLPRSLVDTGSNLYSTTLADDVSYLHLWSIHSDAKGLLGDQILAALKGRERWRRIIIDLRFDTGGDYPDLYKAMRTLPSRLTPDGKVVVITDNTTFSASIITAALVKHFVGDRAIVVGERPRDRLVFWAEGGQIQLPNSKIEIPVSTGMHDWAHGCRDLSRCHWPNIWYGSIGVGNVEPDIRAGWRFEDYRRGVDTVLARALEAP
ncbi:MAG TPA: hypothetical protein VM051_01365 [Usitatibacter sp.]|nr:hypothetical protein [Usitatibacter sp.]